MGYTHYWSINPNDPTLIAAWPQLVEDAQKIAQAADKGEINGVVIETNGVPLLGARPLVADLFGTDKPDLDFEVNSTAGPQAAWGVTA